MISFSSTNSEQESTSFAVKIMVLLINVYQKIFAGRPSTCRFFPSCSSYAIESFEKKGFFKGFFLSVKRILRCNPWGGYGMDYVPENKRRINVWFIGKFVVLVLRLLAFIWHVYNPVNTSNNGYFNSFNT